MPENMQAAYYPRIQVLLMAVGTGEESPFHLLVTSQSHRHLALGQQQLPTPEVLISQRKQVRNLTRSMCHTVKSTAE
jgi:hypothetical protein